MTISVAFKRFSGQLGGIYEKSEAETITAWVFEKLGINKSELLLEGQQVLSKNDEKALSIYLAQLLKHRPIQYVLGESHFYGLKLKVDESVLIPRPETEELVDWCLASLPKQQEKELHLLDIGTGSGCIAIALKKARPQTIVHAIDNSAAALAIAKQNALLNEVEVQFYEMDILDDSTWGKLGKYDVLISNPPYITLQESASIAPNVLQYEPENALFVTDDDPLQFYRAISKFAKKHLSEEGSLFFELHSHFADDTCDLFQKEQWTTELKKDLQGRKRMLLLRR